MVFGHTRAIIATRPNDAIPIVFERADTVALPTGLVLSRSEDEGSHLCDLPIEKDTGWRSARRVNELHAGEPDRTGSRLQIVDEPLEDSRQAVPAPGEHRGHALLVAARCIVNASNAVSSHAMVSTALSVFPVSYLAAAPKILGPRPTAAAQTKRGGAIKNQPGEEPLGRRSRARGDQTVVWHADTSELAWRGQARNECGYRARPLP
jgi:hypothetical protein